MRSLAVMLVLLAACNPPGEFHCGHDEGITFEPNAPVEDLCPYVDRIYAAAEKACEGDPEINKLRIDVIGHDFVCDGRMVHGCAAWPIGIYVRDRRLLPDEIGHLAWINCFQRTGESEDSKTGKTVYDPDFQKFVDSLQE